MTLTIYGLTNICNIYLVFIEGCTFWVALSKFHLSNFENICNNLKSLEKHCSPLPRINTGPSQNGFMLVLEGDPWVCQAASLHPSNSIFCTHRPIKWNLKKIIVHLLISIRHNLFAELLFTRHIFVKLPKKIWDTSCIGVPYLTSKIVAQHWRKADQTTQKTFPQ